MSIKITINNIITKSKQNKKALILWGIIIWAITTWIISPISSYFWINYGPKPNIISNVVLYQDANFSNSHIHMTDFFFLYYLGEDYSTLLFLNASDKRKVSQYDSIITPDFLICRNCAIYSFTIKNTGNKKADKVILDIKSSNIPEIIVDNPKMTKSECGGYFESTGCYIVFENIHENEEINFVLSLEESQDFIITSCYVDDIYPCTFQFIKFESQTINPYKDIFKMDEIRVIFPTLANSPPNTLYYFDSNKSNETQSVWVSIPTIREIIGE